MLFTKKYFLLLAALTTVLLISFNTIVSAQTIKNQWGRQDFYIADITYSETNNTFLISYCGRNIQSTGSLSIGIIFSTGYSIIDELDGYCGVYETQTMDNYGMKIPTEGSVKYTIEAMLSVNDTEDAYAFNNSLEKSFTFTAE